MEDKTQEITGEVVETPKTKVLFLGIFKYPANSIWYSMNNLFSTAQEALNSMEWIKSQSEKQLIVKIELPND